jgi:hypothetical protein
MTCYDAYVLDGPPLDLSGAIYLHATRGVLSLPPNLGSSDSSKLHIALPSELPSDIQQFLHAILLFSLSH